MPSDRRRSALVSLVRAEGSLAAASAALQAFPWDCESPLVVLHRDHIAAVLDRFLSGELDETAVARWASLLEGREDIDASEELESVLFRLATPEINEPITDELVRRLRAELNELAV